MISITPIGIVVSAAARVFLWKMSVRFVVALLTKLKNYSMLNEIYTMILLVAINLKLQCYYNY